MARLRAIKIRIIIRIRRSEISEIKLKRTDTTLDLSQIGYTHVSNGKNMLEFKSTYQRELKE